MKSKKTGGFSLFFRLFKMVKPHNHLISASVLFGIFGNLSAIGLMGFAGAAVASMVAGNGFPLVSILLALGCGLFRGLLRLGEHYFGHDIAFRLLFDMRKQIFAALSRLAPAKLLNRKSGDISASVMADVEYIEIFFAHTIAPIIIAFVVPLVVLVAIGFHSLYYLPFLIPFYLLAGFVVPLLSFRSAKNAGSRYRNALSKVNGSMLENLQGIRDLILLKRDRQRLDSILDQTEECEIHLKSMKNNEALVSVMSEAIMLAAVAVNMCLSFFLMQKGLVEIPSVIFVTILTASSFGPLIALLFLSNSLLNTSAAATRIFALLDETPAVSDLPGAVPVTQVASAPEAGSISFGYPGTGKQLLDHFSFKAPKGQMTAISGESGIGKSTILYLMMRFWDPESGTMQIDEQDLKGISLDSLRENISYFTQETRLFNTTVMENIRIADSGASDEQVMEAAQRAGIHKRIMELPKGYETVAGEEGDRFSTGEKQRIGLARIFLQKNEVILLDEPVSNLDYENEQLIMKNLKNELKGSTILLVSHRKSVVDLADSKIDITRSSSMKVSV